MAQLNRLDRAVQPDGRSAPVFFFPAPPARSAAGSGARPAVVTKESSND